MMVWYWSTCLSVWKGVYLIVSYIFACPALRETVISVRHHCEQPIQVLIMYTMLAQKPGRIRLKSDCECHHFTSWIRERETGCDIPQGTSQIRDRIRTKFRNTEVPVCCLVTESFLYSAFSHDSPFRLRDRFTYES